MIGYVRKEVPTVHIVRVVFGQEWYRYSGQEIRVNIICIIMYYRNNYCHSVIFISSIIFILNLTYNTNQEIIE